MIVGRVTVISHAFMSAEYGETKGRGFEVGIRPPQHQTARGHPFIFQRFLTLFQKGAPVNMCTNDVLLFGGADLTAPINASSRGAQTPAH